MSYTGPSNFFIRCDYDTKRLILDYVEKITSEKLEVKVLRSNGIRLFTYYKWRQVKADAPIELFALGKMGIDVISSAGSWCGTQKAMVKELVQYVNERATHYTDDEKEILLDGFHFISRAYFALESKANNPFIPKKKEVTLIFRNLPAFKVQEFKDFLAKEKEKNPNLHFNYFCKTC